MTAVTKMCFLPLSYHTIVTATFQKLSRLLTFPPRVKQQIQRPRRIFINLPIFQRPDLITLTLF